MTLVKNIILISIFVWIGLFIGQQNNRYESLEKIVLDQIEENIKDKQSLDSLSLEISKLEIRVKNIENIFNGVE
jgi:hypothetical protein